MAVKRWKGDVPAVADVWTVQVTAYDGATTYRLAHNGKSVPAIAAGGVNQTAAALAAAWNASTVPEHKEYTAAANTDTVTLTARAAGVPGTITRSVTGGTGTLGAANNATPATGPNHYDHADNWVPSGVPTTGDDVYLQNSAVDILFGIDQTGVILASLNIDLSYTGKLGNPDYNQGGYYEYREKWLKVGATAVNVGGGSGAGSGRLRIDNLAAQATVNVGGTGQAEAQGVEAMLWKGTHASNVVNVTRGSVGVAIAAGETATIATLRVGYLDSQSSDSQVRLGPGVTLTAVEQTGGTLEVNSALTTLTLTDGECSVRGAGACTTVNIDGGKVYYLSTGTVTNLNVGSDGTADFTRDMRGRTVTNCTLQADGKLYDPHKTVTFTNGVDLHRCSLADVDLDLGTHWTVSRSAI